MGFFGSIIKHRALILELAKNDFKNRYLGSYLGILWAFINPVLTIMVLWFVFEIGFKTVAVKNAPFILWLTCGLLPWYFLVDCLLSACNSITDNSFLVKKVVFKVSLLPVVKILSALFVHLIFLALYFILAIYMGHPPGWRAVQVLYYMFLTIIFTLGLSWLSSSINVFIRDLGQLINIILQFGFWATPIAWSMEMMPPRYHWFIKLNPAYYIVDGYRQSLLFEGPLWVEWHLGFYIWMLSAFMFILGAAIFIRLRPHFADVM